MHPTSSLFDGCFQQQYLDGLHGIVADARYHPAGGGHAAMPSTPRSTAAAQEASTAAVKFREALAAKEDLVRRQQADLTASRLVSASYEGRIRALESRLALAASQAHAGGSASHASGMAASASSLGAGSAVGGGLIWSTGSATGGEADVRRQASSAEEAGTGSLPEPAPASAGGRVILGIRHSGIMLRAPS